MVRNVSAYQQFRDTRQFASLDGFRALSILVVIYHHTATPVDWFPASHRGFLGVDMFFLLSGFLIVTLLLREKERTGRISLRQFYLRRTLRIFPIYYGLLIFLAGVYLTVGDKLGSTEGFFAALPFYLTYTSNWLPASKQAANLAITWSLAAEEQFYLVWPTIEKLLRPRLVLFVLGALLVFNQLINFGLLGEWLREQQTELIMLQITFTPIFLGVLLAHLLHRPRSFAVVYRFLGRRWLAPVLLVLVVVECNVLPDNIQGWPRVLLQLTMLALLSACVIREDHGLGRLLTLRLLRYWGMISYGMYLYHLWALFITDKMIGKWPALASGRVLLCLLLTTLMADLSYRFVERRFLKLKDRWKSS